MSAIVFFLETSFIYFLLLLQAFQLLSLILFTLEYMCWIFNFSFLLYLIVVVTLQREREEEENLEGKSADEL